MVRLAAQDAACFYRAAVQFCDTWRLPWPDGPVEVLSSFLWTEMLSEDGRVVRLHLIPRVRFVRWRSCTNKEIAQQLAILEYTGKNHLANIVSKLQLRRRADAARHGPP